MKNPNQTVWIATDLEFPSKFIGTTLTEVEFADYMRLLAKETNSQVVDSDVVFTEEDRKNYDEMGDALQAVWDCCRFYRPLNEVPTSLCAFSDEELPADDLYIFGITGSPIVVNAACAAVLQRFRLGETRLIPLPLIDISTNEPVPGQQPYYLFNLCERRDFFVPEKSHADCRYVGYERDGYPLHRMLYFDDAYLGGEDAYGYALRRAALDCDLDLWHDPRLSHSICLSQALKEALEAAGMLAAWYVQPCEILDQ